MKSFTRIGFALLVTLLAIVKIASACDECKQPGKGVVSRGEPNQPMLNRHTRSNDETLTIREKLDHLEGYLRILAPHILNIPPVSCSNDSSSFTASS
ncbi:hypothetical protein RCL_jg22291.t1 [Rhizophagus clarus]|uniref:Uncharacterized protein n=1 Tax=Rhizophagus clarus TaxID=94130 RepID=A0A8H3L7E7_9GLOM|nr:hypothetical protein RCL_jg22291.t1 [Rhizophagus clarus]